MITEKIYEADAYQRSFQGTVFACQPDGDSWLTVLDRTCFYPEGGGQPWDTGVLGGCKVTEVQIREGVIYHRTDGPLSVGHQVTGTIDWNRRFDLMQQHSGEHLVSGVVHRLFGLDNVGFHMGADVITVDWNGILTREQLNQVEAEVNRLVWQNLQTQITVPTLEELEQLEYRSKKALDWPVRIVEFPDGDVCACCGTHVRHTGEIGLVKILGVVRMRDGIRAELLCGKRAYDYVSAVVEENRKTSVLLSAKEGETSTAVQRLYQEQQSLKERCAELETAYHGALAERYRDAGDCLLFFEPMSTDSLRRLTVAVMETCGGRCAAFTPKESGGFAYCIGEQGGDLRTLVKEMNTALSGRGGGKPFFAQGAVQAEQQQISAFFQSL